MRFVYNVEINVTIETSKETLNKTFMTKEKETQEQFLERVNEWIKREWDSNG